LPTYGGGSGSPFVGREMGWFGNGRDYSEEAAQAIDAEVKRILEENYNRATTIITNNNDRMQRLASNLMEVETIDRAAFEKLMNESLSTNGTAPEPAPVADHAPVAERPMSDLPPMAKPTIKPA
jgi:cell division protease FtsH